MVYKTVAFTPAVGNTAPTETAATALEGAISEHASDGWEFLGIQNHSTMVPGTNGCFGIGKTSPYSVTMSLLVFKR